MESFTYEQMKKQQDEHWWYLGRKDIIDQIMRNFVGENNKILDIGGGMGGNIELLSKYGKVTIFEKNSYAVNHLTNLNLCQVIQGSFPENIDKEWLNYDVFTMFDVLEHVSNDQQALIDLYNSMKLNGKLILTVPAYQSLFSTHDEIFHHYRRYNIREILDKSNMAGFKIQHYTYFNTLLFPIAYTSRILSKAFPKLQKYEQANNNSGGNLILKNIFSLEKHLVSKFSLPFGLSILLILKK